MDNPDITVNQHEYIPLEPPRPLTVEEQTVIEALIAPNFMGAEQLRIQAKVVRVTAACKFCASILLDVDKSTRLPAQLLSETPISAYTKAPDGMFVEVLLFVREQYLNELQIWRGDGQPIWTFPNLTDATLVFPDGPG